MRGRSAPRPPSPARRLPAPSLETPRRARVAPDRPARSRTAGGAPRRAPRPHRSWRRSWSHRAASRRAASACSRRTVLGRGARRPSATSVLRDIHCTTRSALAVHTGSHKPPVARTRRRTRPGRKRPRTSPHATRDGGRRVRDGTRCHVIRVSGRVHANACVTCTHPLRGCRIRALPIRSRCAWAALRDPGGDPPSRRIERSVKGNTA